MKAQRNWITPEGKSFVKYENIMERCRKNALVSCWSYRIGKIGCN